MEHPAFVALIVFAWLFVSALIGLALRARMPDQHLTTETKEAVRIGMGSVATMAALVLGLLVASTKSAYDTEKGEVQQLAAKIVLLDRTLANYGPEAKHGRDMLRRTMAAAISRLWPAEKFDAGIDVPTASASTAPTDAWSRELPNAIQDLTPQTDPQRTYKSQATALTFELAQMRWQLYEQTETSISLPLLVIMVFWLSMTFVSVGLFAPRNPTVIAAQLMAALSVSGAIFLILELDRPFSGLVQISSTPMLNAMGNLGK